jgi:TetR/AcrR family transcriptional regulator
LLEQFVNKAIDNGDFNEQFSNDFIMKIMRYFFANYFEIFNDEENYDLEKILENPKSLVAFLKYGLGK